MSETILVKSRQTFRLYPTEERALFSARRLHCYLYNACVAHRQYEYKRSRRTVTYLEQQNLLPEFKQAWLEFAYQRFLRRLSKKPKYKLIRRYSGWMYPSTSGWLVNSVTLNDLALTLKMRGKAQDWGKPTTLTIVYKSSQRRWYASFTVEVAVPQPKFGSQSDLKYESIVAYDLGTETAITLFDGGELHEVSNPRFTQRMEEKIRQTAKLKRRKRAPKQGVEASRRWQKINQREAKLKAKSARQRRDWQNKVTSDLARRYDIGVTEKLNVEAMTRSSKKGKKRKAGLNKSILSVGFGTLNQMLTYKIEQKGGLVLQLPTKTIKPSQRCPRCGAVYKDWADLSDRCHVCSACGFAKGRDRGSVMVMYKSATNQRSGLGTSLVSLGCYGLRHLRNSSTSEAGYTEQMKRRKSHYQVGGETPPAYAVR